MSKRCGLCPHLTAASAHQYAVQATADVLGRYRDG